jgi:hypothetical protein
MFLAHSDCLNLIVTLEIRMGEQQRELNNDYRIITRVVFTCRLTGLSGFQQARCNDRII